ncbi:acyclic terpene utilization AtuA family protein [Dactylosporangium sp. AC04546]|uniref:acyclic terpene utilization AtuA family protein n=1 Tax=Dactylosporangium sp. AC04546 TaxID=2862460 RepID=UPI001EDF87C5|nr:acyclic terpene utilization AtuA family protein [Dactylosporangium sp. AC04546]WVK84444.1 acyclic terpene utilization AtuA family protein [Dactylosporangium sp. AC04546]
MIRIGNASGFYGDRASAWQEMLDGGELDVLTGDYLAELTMLILGRDLMKDPSTGYAKTFLRQLEGILETALAKGTRIVTNAGGLNPEGLATAIGKLGNVKVAHVTGDRVEDPTALTANAYLGAFGIAECLGAGADIVVTGRVTDASLVVGPAIAHYSWTRDDLDALAGATVAGHILECGAQATGGNFAFFTELPDGGRRPGFPLAEVRPDGSAVITKHPGTGGAVTVETVTAQLLYEIGTPQYLGPDVVAHFDTIRLSQEGPDRVLVAGVTGSPPPPTLKVGANRLGGFRNTMTFVLCGLQIEEKAALVRAQLEDAIGADGLEFVLARTDHPDAAEEQAASALLAVHLKSPDQRRAGRTFSQAAVELALASYPGLTLTAPPGDATPFGVFSHHLVPQEAVDHVAVLPDGTRRRIPPPPRTAETLSRQTPAGSRGPSTTRAPFGTRFGARSGDKGGDANLGVWARDADGWEWLRGFGADELRELLPETRDLTVERYELPNLRAVNFVIRGILGQGVAASTRFDPQGKALGEWLRSRMVDLP